MGQGKSQFSEEELQDYEVKIFQVNASIIIYIYFLGLNIFFKERSFIVSIFVIGNAFLLLMNKCILVLIKNLKPLHLKR